MMPGGGQRQRFGITRLELLTVVLFGVFGFFWMLVVVPFLIASPEFSLLNPIWQHSLYILGVYPIITAIFGIPLGLLANGPPLIRIMQGGAASAISFDWVVDMMVGPNFLSPQGHIVITNPASLPGTAVDAMFAFIWSSIFPSIVDTSTLYIMVYVVTPMLGLLLAAFILKPRAFFGLVLRGHR